MKIISAFLSYYQFGEHEVAEFADSVLHGYYFTKHEQSGSRNVKRLLQYSFEPCSAEYDRVRIVIEVCQFLIYVCIHASENHVPAEISPGHQFSAF